MNIIANTIIVWYIWILILAILKKPAFTIPIFGNLSKGIWNGIVPEILIQWIPTLLITWTLMYKGWLL